MQRPPIEKLRRLALAGAVVVSLLLAGVYGWRRWRAYEARQDVPTLAEDVQQQAEEFTVSRSEEGRTLFTLKARRTTERTGKTTVLEDVAAVIRGRSGDRADEIRSARCEYDAEGTGAITCPGEVTVKLGAAQPGPGQDAGPSLQLTTTGVRFDTAKGSAETGQPVHFVFAQGSGDAVGIRYQAEEPAVQLQSQVVLQLTSGGAPVRVEGAQLLFDTHTRTLEILPPLLLQSEGKRLTADRLLMQLDADYQTRQVEALGQVRATGKQGRRDFTLRAPRAVAVYASNGNLERLQAGQGVELTGKSPDSDETLTSREAVMVFASSGLVERAVATGDARLVTRSKEETRELRAPKLELDFATADRNQQVLTATERGTLVVKRADGEQRTLVADRIELTFEEEKRLRALAASGDVRTESLRPGGARQTTASDELRARFDDAGNVAEAEQWGGFRYQGERWRATAGRATYRAASETYVLREQPAFWDASTRTTARVIEIGEKSGQLAAEGDVRSTQTPQAKEGKAPGERVHFASERLRADRDRNWARYEGQARMWRGDNRLAADALELFQDERKLLALGHVKGLFFEARKNEEESDKPSRPVTVTSERFTYWEGERRGLFEENVVARGEFGTMTAPRLEVFLAAGAGGATQDLERALASGGVLIEQPDGRATSEQADYRADAQTVVLTGGPPRVVDAERNTVTGAQLTLHLADGTIHVDSDEGTRTVTRRRWTR